MFALDASLLKKKLGSENIRVSKPLASNITITTPHVKLLLHIAPRYFTWCTKSTVRHFDIV